MQFKNDQYDDGKGFLSKWVIAEAEAGGPGKPKSSIVQTKWTNGYEKDGFVFVLYCK